MISANAYAAQAGLFVIGVMLQLALIFYSTPGSSSEKANSNKLVFFLSALGLLCMLPGFISLWVVAVFG